jgi:hypothetical protein
MVIRRAVRIQIYAFKSRCTGEKVPRKFLGRTARGCCVYEDPGPEFFPIDIEGRNITRFVRRNTQGQYLNFQFEKPRR